MNQTTHVTQQNPEKRFGLLAGSVLAVFGLAAGACLSTNSASPATTTTETTITTETTTTGAAVTSSTTTDPPPSTEPTGDEMDALFDEVEASGFDGVVAVRDGADITTRAFGSADRENDVPTDAETVFDIASITKQFTAAAILRLEMDGLLSVDDTLGEHVPGLPDDKAAITLHQLLTHTAGVTRSLGSDYEPIGRDDFITLVADAPLKRAPGGQYEYSNAGYGVLAAVVELVTGESYEEYLQAMLFEPAGMLDTGYVLPDWDDHTIAVGYSHPSGDRFGRPNEQPWNADGPYWHLHGNGGLLSTAADMLRWDEALKGDDVLDATAKAKLLTPHVPMDGDMRYGYGWQFIPMPMGTQLMTHNGFSGAFYADFLRFVDQDVTIFVITNSYRDVDGDVSFGVANHVFDGALTGMDDEEDEPEEASDVESEIPSEVPTEIHSEIDIRIEAAAQRCGFDGLSIASLPDYPELDSLPDSPAGRTASTFLDLLAEGGAAAWLDFATDHVSEELGGDDPTAIADGLVGFQAVFAQYEVARIFEQDESRFHLLMRGPGNDFLLSVGFDETDTERLACIGI